MTLTSMLADFYRRFNYATAPATPVTTRATALLNETHRELVSLPGIEFLRQDVQPVTATANLARTGLPPNVGRILRITDRTNNVTLDQVPLAVLRQIDANQSFTGSYPTRYAVIGLQAVLRQPATTGLWVVSSSASDTTQKAYVESVTTGGYPNQPITAGTAINGVTRVQIGTLATHIEVTKFYIDLVGVGSISLYDAATNGNELARIPIGLTNARYKAVEWWPIQTADVTEYLDYEREIYDLVNGTDEPQLPLDFHWLVGMGARIKEYETLDDDRITTARQQYEAGKLALKAYVLDTGDRIASIRYVRRERHSQLGAMYPAGS